MPSITPTDAMYAEFLVVLGALTKLVVLSMIMERGLAFIFEHEWFMRLTYEETSDPGNPGKTIRKSRFPSLRGLVALAASIGLCHAYEFDILAALFNKGVDGFGMSLTGIVVAGGSAGAIAIFQGFLNFNKDSRDAVIAAKKADAEAAKQLAELNVKKIEAEKSKVDADKAEAEAKKKQVEADAAKAEAERKKQAEADAKAEAEKKKLEGGQ